VAAVPSHQSPDQLALFLAGDALPWPRVPHPSTEELRRFAVDLRVRLGSDIGGFTTFGKAAYLDLGMPRRVGDGWELEVGWRASTAAPLFPVFSGKLQLGRNELRIDGLYAPPGGTVGRVADRMLLHVAANGTARWLLHEIARAVG
jgi:hypothetical protein